MHRLGLWLTTTATLAALGLNSAPAMASPVRLVASTGREVRSAPPRVPQNTTPTTRQQLRGPVGLRPADTMPPLVPQVPLQTRGLPSAVAPLPSVDIYHISAQQVLINQDRANNGGLPPLAWSPCLYSIAVQNAQRIAAQGFLSHTNGPTLDLGCDPGYRNAGENIAYTSVGIDDPGVNTLFMNSAPHRANILSTNYRFVGTAWVVAPNGFGYIAEEFAG